MRRTRSSPTRPRPSSATSRGRAVGPRSRATARWRPCSATPGRCATGCGTASPASFEDTPPPCGSTCPRVPRPSPRWPLAGASGAAEVHHRRPRRRGALGDRGAGAQVVRQQQRLDDMESAVEEATLEAAANRAFDDPALKVYSVGRRRDDRPRRRPPDRSGFLVAHESRRSTPTAPTSSGATPAPGPSSRSVCSATIPPSSRSRRAPISTPSPSPRRKPAAWSSRATPPSSPAPSTEQVPDGCHVREGQVGRSGLDAHAA